MPPLLEFEKFTITAEVSPPKGVDLSTALHHAEIMPVDALNVTDNQRAVMRMSPLAVAASLKARGYEVVMQLTCRDRNRLALQSVVLGAAAMGIENISAMTGDHPVMGDHPSSMSVYDIDSVQLLEAISGLMRGIDMSGNQLNEAPRFRLGAVVNPGADPLEPQVIKLEKKVESGAEFVQTQAVYDLARFEDFMDSISHIDVRVLAGIIPLKSRRMAEFMNRSVPGVTVPDDLIERVDEGGGLEEGVTIAREHIRELRGLCDGVHIMPIGTEEHVRRMVK